MENKVKVWLARDEDGVLYVFTSIPSRKKNIWSPHGDINIMQLKSNKFPSVKWEDDEPIEAYITLAEPQEQPKPKQEIDWEQRRYEIAKELLPSLVLWEDPEKNAVNYAVKYADMLINKLKEQNK